MNSEDYLFSATVDGGVEPAELEAQIVADGTLPPLNHISTVKPAGQSGTISVVFDVALDAGQKLTLDGIVAAHDSAAAALKIAKDSHKLAVDVHTANCHAIRQIAAMTAQQIDDDAAATKGAIDAAASVSEVEAAVAADPRPRLQEPVVG